MVMCTASKEQLTYQLHPGSPRPQQEHCRGGRETGSCARKSHGGVSSPAPKEDSSR